MQATYPRLVEKLGIMTGIKFGAGGGRGVAWVGMRGTQNGPVPAGAQMDRCLGLCWGSGRLSPCDFHTLFDLSREAWPKNPRLVGPKFPQWLQPPGPLTLYCLSTFSSMPGPFLTYTITPQSEHSLPDHSSLISILRMRFSQAQSRKIFQEHVALSPSSPHPSHSALVC